MRPLLEDQILDVCDALLKLQNKEEAHGFLKDLCTPQEIRALAERWHVCKLLHQGDLSYREIHRMTGASLTTITRVARFLKDEPHDGYRSMLTKFKSQEMR